MSEGFITLDLLPNFEISTTIPHVFKKKDSNTLINQSINNVGYYTISLDGNTYLVHRLIAQQFIPNPENFSDVNHKNKCRTDNRVENLEWISHTNNLKQRKPYKKQKSEFVNEIESKTIINIGDYCGYNLDRYYFDYVDNTIYLKQSRTNKFKIVHPTINGNIQIIALVSSDKGIITRSYPKLIRDFQSIAKEAN